MRTSKNGPDNCMSCVLNHVHPGRPAPTRGDVAVEELAPAQAAEAGGVARHGAQRLVDRLRAAICQDLSKSRDGGQRAEDVVGDLWVGADAGVHVLYDEVEARR